ncbi:MAG: NAD(P)H-dependent oxidoreductase [Boseongicola sp.]|nr:NAD(P)H-dependent oxidoreductase [Boseongicola sp.]
MTCILHIDASARENRSISRNLSAAFVERWLAVRPSDEVIRRDVGKTPPPLVSETWIDACFTPEPERTEDQKKVLEPSDTLIDELARADVIALGTPMYNYGLPASLKAWVDQVIRVNKTFSFDLARGDYPLEPILSGKTLVCMTSKGEFGFAPGGIREKMNHLDPHIETFAHYLGVAETCFVNVEYQEFGDLRHDKSLADAIQDVIALAESLTRDLAA